MQWSTFFNVWYIVLFLVSFLATRGVDGEPGIFLLGHIILGISYFVYHLKWYQKVEKIHLKHLILFPIIAFIPLFLTSKLEGMAGILFYAIPISAFSIILITIILLLIKEYIKTR